jgi:hypothetical protein
MDMYILRMRSISLQRIFHFDMMTFEVDDVLTEGAKRIDMGCDHVFVESFNGTAS